MRKILHAILCVLLFTFFLAMMNDFIMGCGEGYHTANGYVPPDYKGCIFSTKKGN
jgi:hypothetical protein